jgi:hypothetical protein
LVIGDQDVLSGAESPQRLPAGGRTAWPKERFNDHNEQRLPFA